MSTSPAIRVLLLLALAAAASGGCWAVCAAGADWVGVPLLTVASATEEQSVDVFLPAPRKLKQQLQRARKALDEKRYSDAVAELGALLSDSQSDGPEPSGEAPDYFIGPIGEPGVQASLKAEAQRLLGGMPPEGREYYELQFGADARAMLDQALADGDARKLTEVSRRYFHTQAGYEATMLLGRRELDHGRPLAAAMCFERLAGAPAAAGQYEPDLSVLLAACWVYAKAPQKAGETLIELKRRMPGATLQAGDRRISLFPDDSQALAWLENLLGTRGLAGVGEASQWLMFRGNAARNARSRGGLPLLTPRWRVPTVNDPTDDKLVRQLVNARLAERLPALPSLHPLAVRDVVLMRSSRRLIAVDFPTGKRIWEYPWFEASEEAPASPDAGRGRGGESAKRMGELDQRLWQDAPYGQMSSDGESAFVLSDLGYAQAYSSHPPILLGPMGRRFMNPDRPAPHNRLVALDLSKEGKLRWMVGGQDGEDEPKLAGAFFLGAPLPLLDRLYVLAELSGEIRLVVLDAATGRLDWQQQLAHVDTRTILLDPVRRLAGATPAFADGVLVCPTSAGAIVALDLATRSLLWGRCYEQPGAQRQRAGWLPFPPQVAEPGRRWTDASPMIADGRLLFTPVESDSIYCLDLLTGRLLWEPQKQEDFLYVACAHEGVAVLVSKDKVSAIRLADGRAAWPEAIQLAPDTPSGRGFYSDRFYCLPTTGAEILKIDIPQGKVASRVRTESVLGNVICYKEEILSQGVDWLAAYYQGEPLRVRVAERLRAEPDDAWALARKGELLLQDGQRREALAALRRAHQLEPENEATRCLLVALMLGALRDDFNSYRDCCGELEQLIDQPQRRAEYLRLAAEGLQAGGRLGEAFDAILRLAALDEGCGDQLEAGGPMMEQVDRDLVVRRHAWVRAHLASLLAAAQGADRAHMDQAVNARSEAVLQSADVSAFREFIDYFGCHPAADRVRLRLADLLMESGDWLEAELHLVRAESSIDHAAAAAAALARLLEKAGRYDEAAASYRRLADRWGDVVCRDAKTGKQLLAAAAANNDSLRRALEVPDQWPYGKTRCEEQGEALGASPGYQRVYPVELQEQHGHLPVGLQLVRDERRGCVAFRDGRGNEILQVSLGANVRYYTNFSFAKASGHLILLSIDDQLGVVDALRAAEDPQEAVLWRQGLFEPVPGLGPSSARLRAKPVKNQLFGARYVAADTAGRPMVVVGPFNDTGVCFQRLRELVCAAPLTGQPIWVRDHIELGSDIFGDEELVFVAAPEAEEAVVLSALDGRSLGRRKVGLSEHRWATLGRRVLVSKDGEDGRPELRLYDAWTQKDVWRRQFAEGSRARLVGRDEVAVMQRDGALVVLSLEGDRVALEASLPAAPRLEQICVLRSSDQYLLAIHEPGGQLADRDVNIAVAHLSSFAPMIDGRVYAFERPSGKLQWKNPAIISQYALPLDQPAEIPLLAFLRQKAVRSGNVQRQYWSVLCIDRRDGRVLLAKDDIPATVGACEIAGNPETGVVVLKLPGANLKLTFTSDPLPPQPPAKTDAAPGVQAQKPSPLRQLSSAIWNAIRNAQQ